MRDPPAGGAGRKASEEKRLRRTPESESQGVEGGVAKGKALSFSLPGAWRGRGDTTQETDFFACLRRA